MSKQQKGTTMNKQELIDGIEEDYTHLAPAVETIVNAVDTAGWLHNPDQVPGRTITAGEVGRHAHLIRSIPIAGQVETPTIIDFLEALGITVVPDPELPTEPGSVVRMRKAHQWVRTVRGAWISTDGSVLDAAGAQEIADEHGFEVVA